MFEIGIKSHFCGAHKLDGYRGQCANLHGHNWEVEIILRANKTGRTGMVADFKDLKAGLNDCLQRLDHRDLNALSAFKRKNPTAENIARHIFNELYPRLKCGACRLHSVRVSESPVTFAIYSRR